MKNTEFERMKGHFERLCKQFGVKVPRIKPALPTDPCDFTDPEINEVRINLRQKCERGYQVRHLFGHYLADLHAVFRQRYSDNVADAVAKMLNPLEGFRLSPAEQKRADAWIKKHKREHRLKTEGAIGGRWQYAFIPTGIGTVVEVCCTVCGAKEDVTDYACW